MKIFKCFIQIWFNKFKSHSLGLLIKPLFESIAKTLLFAASNEASGSPSLPSPIKEIFKLS